MTPEPLAPRMARQPVAYVRRSVVREDSPGNISRETQLAAIRARAAIDGHNGDLLILEDWGKSGRGKARSGRKEYARLLAMVESDQVSTIYVYNWSRLGRSTRDLLSLADLCALHSSIIVAATGMSPDPTTADGRMLLTILTAVDEWQAEVQAERAAGGIEAWREAHPGEKLGRPYYGDLPGESLETVIATFEKMGGYRATATELNRIGLPSRRTSEDGRPRWAASSVRRILTRAGKAPQHGRKGAKVRVPHVFSGLLKCQCSTETTAHFLTGSLRAPDRQGRRLTIYRCLLSDFDQEHHPGKKSIAEAVVLRWAMEQTAKLRPPQERVLLADDVEGKRAALDARLERLRVAFLAGLIDEAGMRAEKADIDASLTALDAEGQAVEIPGFEWREGVDPAIVNATLRTLWSEIPLGPGMTLPERPVRLLPDEWWAD